MTPPTGPGLTLATTSPRMSVNYLRMLVYGPPGAGKTYFAGTFDEVEKAMPVLYLEREGGPMTIRDRNVEMFQLQSTSTIETVRRIMGAEPGKWGTIILDSLSGYYGLLIGEIVGGRTTSTRPDDLVPELRDYLKATLAVRRHVRVLTSLNCHLVVTALDTTTKDELTGGVLTHPSVSGKVAREIGAYFDIVGHMSVKRKGLQGGRERVLMVQPAARTQAKDRTGLLGDELVDPTAAKIFAKVFGASTTITAEAPTEVPAEVSAQGGNTGNG